MKTKIVLNHVHRAIGFLAQVSTIAIAIILAVAVIQYRKAPPPANPRRLCPSQPFAPENGFR